LREVERTGDECEDIAKISIIGVKIKITVDRDPAPGHFGASMAGGAFGLGFGNYL